MKNPAENNEVSIEGSNIGGIHAENFTLYFIGNNNSFVRAGSNAEKISMPTVAAAQKYSYLTDSFEKLTFSQRAKVLSLIAKLLKEQENQP